MLFGNATGNAFVAIPRSVEAQWRGERHDTRPGRRPGLSRAARYGSVAAIWVLALVLAIVIAAVSERAQDASWISLALAACVIVGLIAQLATQRKEGFVNRLAASVSGAFVILGVTAGILALVAAAR
ncbi:hypothetical protein [Leifsonia poae]|uniref:hypothetical protein n=1 Tax=Leifsonia poae TaxID=110933 RepID=UPI001CBB7C25|nr:hypothetical protein [Leifsonia poae]